ncbi:MAG: PmoA family protein [Flavobacteriaceae bacterium]
MRYYLNWTLSSIFIFLLLTSCKNQIQIELINNQNLEVNTTIAQAKLPDGENQSNYRLLFNGNELPYQIKGEWVYWKVTPENYKGPFTWELNTGSLLTESQTVKKENGQHSIYINDTKILGYQMEVTEAPEGVNPAYRRSGYIHPLNTPMGKRLTRIQPEDHYHHYGLWNPWTHTLFEGDTLDFWNLYKEEGTVRFASLLSESNGPVFSEFEVLHEHVVLKENKDKIALNEVQKIRVTPVDSSQYYLDFEIQYTPATESDFKIIEYRYGGFGWRTTEEWDNQNSRVLSSEGNTRTTADGSTAVWCIVDGKLDEGYGGAVMMSHPENYNHPEPLRIWPENQYGRGDLFANFATTKNTDWIMKAGQTYTLRYRLVIYDGMLEPAEANQQWNLYAKPLTYQFKS